MIFTIQFIDPRNGSRSPGITNSLDNLPGDISLLRDEFVNRLKEDNEDITDSEIELEVAGFDGQLVIVVVETGDDEKTYLSSKPLMTIHNFVSACENYKELDHE